MSKKWYNPAMSKSLDQSSRASDSVSDRASDRTSDRASDIVGQLQAKGLRVTPQRAAIYANLLNRTDHPTVEQILADLNGELPLSSKATVYSALNALQAVGLVRQVLLEEGVTRYDAHVASHHHFRCQACGAIQDLAWEVFDAPHFERLPTGLQVNSHEVTIHGLCERCACQGDQGNSRLEGDQSQCE